MSASTLPVDIVDTCGSGYNFLFQGVFGNKSFGKNEEAKFIITLQIPVQKYNFPAIWKIVLNVEIGT
jgi:hypothetical protein